MFKLRAITKLLMCVFIIVCASVIIPLTSYSMDIDGKTEDAVKTNLHAKYYQQALYYYFQGNYSAALNVISVGKLRLGSLDQTSQLFEAGIQINMGLQELAKQTLLTFGSMHPEAKGKSDELLVFALLSLTEQFIEQGEIIQAQQTLAKIAQITPRYYQQYHVLSQLAYWPEEPVLLPMSLQKNYMNSNNMNSNSVDPNLIDVVYESPYIQLNKSLRFIEEGNFIPAIDLLTTIKNRYWQAAEQTFWQLLFTTDNDLSLEKQTEVQLQNQAINDYARLLLAQIYAQQEAYEKVFFELKSFPQQSPYTEPALYLFAFSAQKIKQHTIALSLLTLLHEKYPYSHLGWQAGLLMAKQVTDQKGLTQGWQSYQQVEVFFLERLENLNHFETNYSASADLLAFSIPIPRSGEAIKNYFARPFIDSPKLEAKLYTPDSIWLQQALYDASLDSLYKQLAELTIFEQHNHSLQRKSDWIEETIKLNTQRKARIAASQAAMDQQGVYEKLIEKRASLAAVLSLALSDPQQNGFAFANEEEQALLERIERSKENLAYLVEHGDKSQQGNVDDYQQRLTRLDGVLIWQLKQQYPQRAWQHKQQLVALDQNLTEVAALQNKISQLLANASKGQSDYSLLQLTNRQVMTDKKISPLAKHLKQLKSKVSLTIRGKVAGYVDEQRNVLTQYLLTTRKAMADVLEQMSINDKKMEKQLNLGDKVNKDQSNKEQAL